MEPLLTTLIHTPRRSLASPHAPRYFSDFANTLESVNPAYAALYSNYAQLSELPG